ncbi:MAG: tRNA (N6-isopentenyl adenosine(37)-C2)-methylthiotransferase MiaB [Chloroflexota bacterium]|nr:tRNA (N6-isopentenyl adenosine(37)-C2)-methylthiotransferase MiaB [Chloroflexota bacterium]
MVKHRVIAPQEEDQEHLHYYLWNIGCQMNRADAYRIGEALERRGYLSTQDPKEANLLVLNTCVVRQSAEGKVVGRLSSLRPLKEDHKKRALVVMGCFVGDADTLASRYPFVDAFFPPSAIDDVIRFAEEWALDQGKEAAPEREPLTPPHVADFVPISYGCNRHCTYCIVTLRRGEQRSRPISEIRADVENLVRRGTRDITLLGQNVDAYGSDLPQQKDLADVFEAIHDIEDLWRIRFLTSHPADMTQHIIDAVAAYPKVCPCWELAVQSGDNEILRRMARGYTVEKFRNLVRRIREATPDGAINTDVIVGFPGETREQFENTLRLIRDIRFDMVHVAAYSPRPGTPAATWEDDVPPAEKERRRARTEAVQEQIAGEINAAWLNQEVEILVDGKQRERWRGRTRTHKLVFFESEENWLGRMARVHVTWTGPWSMVGDAITA